MEDNNRSTAFNELYKRINGEPMVDYAAFDEELTLLKGDLKSANHKLRNAAISVLKALLNINESRIQDYVIDLLDSGDSATYCSVFHAMKIYLKEKMCNNDFNFTEIYNKWMIHDVKKMQLILKEVYENELSSTQQKDFLLNSVVKTMMSVDLNDSTRTAIMEIAFLFLDFSSIAELSSKELSAFTLEVTSRYVENISNLRDNGYDNWHKLWIFLIRYFNKKLHNSMNLTNKLLRVVEYAFRNPSVHQRLRGYDCWKELIDNASLERKHLCSSKQIKLLVTPLRAKFSKQEIVICKRFEVFVYLLEKLQDDVVLVLPEFLEFCFGTVKKDSAGLSKIGQAKAVPDICLSSISAFLEIIGHSHQNECINDGLDVDTLKLLKPAVNSENIESYHRIILHSASECCMLLERCTLTTKISVQKLQNSLLPDEVLNCLWKSIFNIVLNAKTEIREKCLEFLISTLEEFLRKKEEYYNEVLHIIFDVFMSFDVILLNAILPKILETLIKIYFKVTDKDSDAFETLNLLINNSDMLIQKRTIQSFGNVKSSEVIFKNVAGLWKTLVHNLIPKELDDIRFLLWPLRHHHFDSIFQIDAVYEEKLRSLGASEILYGLFVKELETLFKENPLLCNEILETFKVVGLQSGKNVNIALKLLGTMLILPGNKNHHHLIAQILSDYLKSSNSLQNIEAEAIKNLCICLERLLSHKNETILMSLETHLSNANEDIRRKYSKHISKALLDLSTSDSKPDFVLHVGKVLSFLEASNAKHEVPTTPDTFKAPKSISRSAKIANLAQNQDSPKSIKPAESSLSLKLFGKDLDTLSPLKVKGSQLNNSIPVRSKKIVNLASPRPLKASPRVSLGSNEEKDSDFIPIDTEVKIDRHKLTENQKEVLKKRREDIPALYQDLTQSSQEYSTDSTSNSNIIKQKENTAAATVVKEDCDDSKEKSNVVNCTGEKQSTSSEILNSEIDINRIEDITVETVDSQKEDALLDSSQQSKETVEITQTMETTDQASADSNKEDVESTEKDDTPNISKTAKGSGNDKRLKEQKRKLRLQQELKKLSMDIVGADEFLSRSSKRNLSRKEIRDTTNSKKAGDKVLERHRRKTIGCIKEMPKESASGTVEKSNRKGDNENRRTSLNLIEELLKSAEKEIYPKQKKKKVKQSPKDDVSDDSSLSQDTSNVSLKSDTCLKVEIECLKENEDSKNISNHSKNSVEDQSSSAENGFNETESQMDDDLSFNTEKLEVSSKRGKKRKRLIESDEEDEDIIESSQESFSRVLQNSTAAKNSSNQNVDLAKTISVPEQNDSGNSSEKTLINKDVTLIEEEQLEKSSEEQNEKNCADLVENITLDKSGDDVETNSQKNGEEQNEKNCADQVENITLDKSGDDVETNSQKSSEEQNEKNCADQVENITLDKSGDDVETNSQHNLEHTQNIVEETEPEKLSPTQATQTQRKSTQSQDTQTQESNSSNVEQSEFKIHLDIPKKPELTESEQQISVMDTLSFTSNSLSQITSNILTNNAILQTQKSEVSSSELIQDNLEKDAARVEAELSAVNLDVSRTPPSSNSTLPSSPVTNDTPNRTTELLNNTFDISPINSQSNDEECVSSTSKEDYIVNFKAESVELERNEEKLEVNFGENLHLDPPKDLQTTVRDRSCRLLNMVSVESPLSISQRNLFLFKRRRLSVPVSPSATRIKKLMSTFKNVNTENVMENVAEEDILTFSREVPSPLALPRSSILKRKLSDTSTEEVVSPCPKRKRVNFSDPCTTSKKIFIKDECYKENTKLEARCLFDVSKDMEDKDLKDLFEGSEPCTESDNIETEKSLEIENPLILFDHKPIYPDLVDCQDSVYRILRHVSSPMFMSNSVQMLKSNRITTIGDLASESEANISRYPFKVPVVSNVYKALDRYYQKSYKSGSTNDSPEERDSSPENDGEMPPDSENDDDENNCDMQNKDRVIDSPTNFSLVIVDSVQNTKDEFKELLQKVVNEKIPFEDISDIITEMLDSENFAQLVRTGVKASKISLKNLMSESEFQSILKHFIEKNGLPKIFELLTDTVESSEDESIYFDCMIKHSIEKRPLSALLEKRSLVEIRTGLKECIEQNMFAREDLIEICLTPLIKTPKDLCGYFNKLSVVQIKSVIITRLQGEEFKQFVSDILDTCGKDNVLQYMKKHNVVKQCSVEDITNAISEEWSPNDIIESFKKCINANSLSDQQTILVEMVKFASTKLPISTLTELHIEFLRKIPQLLEVD